MVELLAFAELPTWYQVALYRELARELGDRFHAVFHHGGHADGIREDSWGGAHIVNATGLLEGYNNTVLCRREGLTRAAAAKLSTDGLSDTVKRLNPKCVLVNNHGRSAAYRSVIGTGKALGSRLLLRSTPYDLRPTKLGWDLGRSIFLRGIYSFFDAFCAVGTLPRLHFARYSGRPSDVYFSPYCVDEFFLHPRALPDESDNARRQFRRAHGIGEAEHVFLSLARLVPVKRLDLTFAAFEQTLQARDARLVVLGDGVERALVETWQGRLGDRLVWIGAQGREGVAAALAGADALILASDYEPWGVVLNEALTFHKPVVSSDNVAASFDLVLDDLTGYRFRAGDLKDYVKALHKLHALLDRGIDRPSVDALMKTFSAENAARGVIAAMQGTQRASPTQRAFGQLADLWRSRYNA
jgi:glycosyltransferase involved in cell wall biosynthesis